MQNTSDRKKEYLFLVLTILWMVFIFCMSQRSGPDSSGDSAFVSTILCRIFYPGFRDLNPEAKAAILARMSLPIRKTAHAAEYAVLGMLWLSWIRQRTRRKSRTGFFYLPHGAAISAWILSVMYAATDEFHQRFIPERSGEIKDVGVDALGALIGILVLTCIFFSKASRRQQKKPE